MLQLTTENQTIQKKINHLIGRDSNYCEKLSDEEVKKSSCYKDCDTMRAIALSERDNMKLELDNALKKWSITKGDLLTARKTIDELVDKHNKRWKELVGHDYSHTGQVDFKDLHVGTVDRDSQHIISVRKISELENKLKHALDMIRQTDMLRTSLNDASNLNEVYQAKVDELKTKISELSADKRADRPNLGDATVNDAGSLKPAKSDPSGLSDVGSASNSDEKAVRKIKKELSAALVSKDQARAKQEVSRSTNSSSILIY